MARPSPTSSTPVASGSRVPAWPTRRCPKMRRHRATTSCEVQPASLSTTTRPLTVDAPGGPASAGGSDSPRSGVTARRPADSPSCSPRRSSSTREPATMAGSAWKVSRGVRFIVICAPTIRCRWTRRSSSTTDVCVVERGEVHHRRPHVRRGVDRGHGHHRQLVGVDQPLELLRHHLPQHLVDPQRPRVCRRPPSHSVSSSARPVREPLSSWRSPAPRTSRSRRPP